jgi:hypothetical protein
MLVEFLVQGVDENFCFLGFHQIKFECKLSKIDWQNNLYSSGISCKLKPKRRCVSNQRVRRRLSEEKWKL